MAGSSDSDGRSLGRRRDSSTDGIEPVGAEPGAEDLPVVGIVATPEAGDAVVRTTVRARRRGYDVLVTHGKSTAPECVDLAADLGAVVVEHDSPERGEGSLRNLLAGAAVAYSYSGVILQSERCDRIDFERTLEAFDETDDRTLEAVSEASRTMVLAGIPAYNEADTIGEVVQGAHEHVDEVLVVDDGSDDATAAQAREAGATVVEHERNRNYGEALKTVFREAYRRDVGHLVTLDADGQHDPADIPDLVDTQRETDAEVVIANRFDGDTSMPLYRRVGTRLINGVTNVSLNIVSPRTTFGDTQNGFRAYDAAAVESLAEDARIGDDMDASIDIIYHAYTEGLSFAETPTTIDYDVDDANSQDPISHGMTLLHNLLVILERERPITVFGVPGLLGAIVGVGAGYWTVSNYLTTGEFSVGLALLSVLLLLAGTIACFVSLVLHSLNTYFADVQSPVSGAST